MPSETPMPPEDVEQRDPASAAIDPTDVSPTDSAPESEMDESVPEADTAAAEDETNDPSAASQDEPIAREVPEGMTALNKRATVLLDKPGGRVLLRAKVVLREGLLEMLCCPAGTKEHESILAVESAAYVVHAGLMALGADPGRPVQYFPEYKPPSGQTVDIFLTWTDADGKLERVPAQRWIRHVIHRYYVETMEHKPAGLQPPDDSMLKYDEKHDELLWYGPMSADQRDRMLALSDDSAYREAINSFYEQSQPRQMEADWLFVGSNLFTDPNTGEQIYEAEVGDLICVANFPSATIDVSVASTPSGEENLLYEAYTEHIPPLDTPVTIELIPQVPKEADSKTPDEE